MNNEVIIPETFKKAACFELFLRLCSESEALTIEALKTKVKSLTSEDAENKRDEDEKDCQAGKFCHSRISRCLPERLKKRLVGELCLLFSRDFPLIQVRINEIDRHLSQIIVHMILLMENLAALPEDIRNVVLEKLTSGNKELQEKLAFIDEEMSGGYYRWVKNACELVQDRIKKISEILERGEY
ncbi:MAG: hypothetical protein LWW94_08540 [Candidatus Desulfofervidaceae bacterium]|nr:hypothetical protein [Candidatus Desulfofervidaceae bacterium]